MRQAVVASIVTGLSAFAFAANAGEICVACEQPAATYSCNIEQPSEKHQVGGDLANEICSKVLANKGGHQKCQVTPVPQEGKCPGGERTVTLTDLQRAMAGPGESTYEVGALEIARRNVHDTWLCVTSMFKDC
jgi:hypothetical protein